MARYIYILISIKPWHALPRKRREDLPMTNKIVLVRLFGYLLFLFSDGHDRETMAAMVRRGRWHSGNDMIMKVGFQWFVTLKLTNL